MRGRRNVWMSLTAALLSAALVYGLYQLQRLQTERQDTIGVIAPKRFIAAGERLEHGDLMLIRLPNSAYMPDMATDMADVAGKEVVIPLGMGEPVMDWKLDELGLQPRRTESTFQIPKDYIRSISNGIRAGDRVKLYASGEEGESRRILGGTVVVASVKNAGNVEVDGLEQPHLMSLAEGNKARMYAARREANGLIEYLNLNLTEAQWLEIDSLCKDGKFKLVVAYSPESFDRLEQSGRKGEE